MAEPLRWATGLLAIAAIMSLVTQWSQPIGDGDDQTQEVFEDRLEPTDFSPEELRLLLVVMMTLLWLQLLP